MLRVTRWLARALGILFVLFVALFATSVFSEGYAAGDLAIAFTMQLIPAIVVLVALVIAWKWETLGGFLFILLGGVYIIIGITGAGLSYEQYLVISAPLFIIGILFIVSHVAGGRNASSA